MCALDVHAQQEQQEYKEEKEKLNEHSGQNREPIFCAVWHIFCCCFKMNRRNCVQISFVPEVHACEHYN